MKRAILVSALISVVGFSSAFAAGSVKKSLVLANCPDDYYGVYAITPTDYVTIGLGESGQMVIEFAGNEYSGNLIGGCVTNPESNGAQEQVSCSISCKSNGILDLTIDQAQHNFSKNGNDLVVDGKTYPIDAVQ